MRVGYLPDMFGHIAQMPQILRRAGIERAVVWRGVPTSIDRNTLHVAVARTGRPSRPSTSSAATATARYLFDVPDRLAVRSSSSYRRLNARFYGERSLLAMYGTDHAVPSPRLADLVDAVNAGSGDVEVRLETLADYLERDRDRQPGPAGDAAGAGPASCGPVPGRTC